MIETTEVQRNEEVIKAIICDRCKKRFTDSLNWQEFHHIDFIGGYISVFGDEAHVTCDICQDCLKELIGDFCRYS